MAICVIKGCDKEISAKAYGLCKQHYEGEPTSFKTEEKKGKSPAQLRQPRSNRHGYGRRVLDREKVANIKWFLLNGYTRTELAAEYDVTYDCIRLIDIGRIWKDVEPLEPSQLENVY